MLRQVQPGNGRDTMQTPDKSQNVEDNGLYLVGLGANLPSKFGPPLATLIAALAALDARNVRILARSAWFESEPVPKSDQNWFINAVVCVHTLENSHNLLKILHEIEIEFGRIRSVPNAPRPLDLDLLLGPASLQGVSSAPKVLDLSGSALVLPHPRLTERAFVLRPLATIVPDWAHPGTGLSVAEMAAKLSPGPVVRLLQR
jgi:2-amino-4-hydroxy-6-hydroxymethyldihydropteridine diphosphokinase